jgi:integrase
LNSWLIAAPEKAKRLASLVSDSDFANGRITIKGDPDTGTKNWEIRIIPVIPDMRRLLERTHSEKEEAQWLNNPVVGVRKCQKAIDSACKKLGIARFTHHELRHSFATRCIESGIDIQMVSFEKETYHTTNSSGESLKIFTQRDQQLVVVALYEAF